MKICRSVVLADFKILSMSFSGKYYKPVLDVAKSRIGTITGGSVAQSKDKHLIENTDVPYFCYLDEVCT